MNRNLGTTIILTAPSDINIKYFASVLIFLTMGTYGKSDPVVYELQIKTDLTQKKGEIVKGKIEKIEGPNSFAACNSK